MPTLRVHDVLKDRVLVSRESARLLKDALGAMLNRGSTSGNETGATSVSIDFERVEGVAPSFLDEVISIFESVVGTGGAGQSRSLLVAHPPARLSLKFEALARGHAKTIRVLPDGSWLLTDARSDDA